MIYSQHPPFKPSIIYNILVLCLLIQGSVPLSLLCASLQMYIYTTGVQGANVFDQRTCERKGREALCLGPNFLISRVVHVFSIKKSWRVQEMIPTEHAFGQNYSIYYLQMVWQHIPPAEYCRCKKQVLFVSCRYRNWVIFMNGLTAYSHSKMQELSGICECFGSVFPQWSSADAEVKVPQLRTQSCQGFSSQSLKLTRL